MSGFWLLVIFGLNIVQVDWANGDGDASPNRLVIFFVNTVLEFALKYSENLF